VSRDWLLYLDDLIGSAEKIQRFLKGRALEGFASDEMLFDAVLFNLEVIGEAVKKLPAEAKTAVPEGDWSGPARMRDLIAHHYFAVDPEIVWEAATQHVPRILEHARRVRKRFDRGEKPAEESA
jgi:uncharacterized protein with HEPN domain